MKNFLCVLLASFATMAFATGLKQNGSEIDARLTFATQQLDKLRSMAITQKDIPRSTNPDGSIHWITGSDEWKNNAKLGVPFDWTEGFFPGTCWYLYEYTKENKWKECAQELMTIYRSHSEKKGTHDLGFVFQPSYGKGFKLTGDKDYKACLIEASNVLVKRFYPAAGCIKSWDEDKDWQKAHGWTCPVIIDNMINLEMLFETSLLTGDSIYAKVAMAHANATMKNHYRPDMSCCHVVDYDTVSGKVISKVTAQGYSNSSSWARGQAWGLYGFTMCYRYTKNVNYLNQSKKIASFILKNKNLPADKIPYWDFSSPDIPKTYRDASAAAIIASALIELDEYAPEMNYLKIAKEMMNNLSSSKYLAVKNGNKNFLLMHNVGSIPHMLEVDVPINYSDYYYVEALMRLKTRESKEVSSKK